MPHKRKSRIDLEIDLSSVFGKSRKMLSHNKVYDWDRLLPKRVLMRHRWLAKTWREIYSKNPHDEYIRFLSTDDQMNTKWFEKYGYKEPNFID